MSRAMWYLVAAAVLVYLFLRPQRGKVGTTAGIGPAATGGPGTQVGALVDGVWRIGKELFGGDETPTGTSGGIVAEDIGGSIAGPPPDWSAVPVDILT